MRKEETLSGFIGHSPLIKKIMENVRTIAKSSATVFISGESGTGKEEIAKAIHLLSPRSSKPFICVNCSAIAETLIESEFFGHEKGSFTGAAARRLGRFERADSGTLLLDEISEVPLSFQAKLLRAVQEKEIERVGGNSPIGVDVRLIATSNRNMLETVKKGLFREDLYYRLNVIQIHLPTLRERKEDIVLLAEYFLKELGSSTHKLTERAKQMLFDYNWPGNIRELKNVMERTLVMSQSEIIDEKDLCLDLPKNQEKKNLLSLKEVEKAHILHILESFNHNRTESAKALKISVRTLRNKLLEYAST